MNSTQKTAIYRNDASYPINVPFHPSESYPEYPFPGDREVGFIMHIMRLCMKSLASDATWRM
jgi:hypothetical protein